MNINGGIAVTYHDNSQEYGPIEVFAQFEELNRIRRDVTSKEEFKSLSDIVTSAYAYHLTEEVYREHPEVKGRLSKGHDYDLKSNILELMPEVFTDTKTSEDDLLVWGRENNQRATESFISIGAFDTEVEAKYLIKYLKCRFSRTMVSILKVTQAITPEKWKYVPLQNFTRSSDIDWSKSIAEIDDQLFDKYDSAR